MSDPSDPPSGPRPGDILHRHGLAQLADALTTLEKFHRPDHPNWREWVIHDVARALLNRAACEHPEQPSTILIAEVVPPFVEAGRDWMRDREKRSGR